MIPAAVSRLAALTSIIRTRGEDVERTERHNAHVEKALAHAATLRRLADEIEREVR